MREPTIPKSGEEVKASTIADIIRWVKSIVPRGDGKTIQVKTSPGGSIISSYSEPGSSAVILELGSVKEFSSKLSRYIYNATAYINFDDTTGASCYAIPVNKETSDESNILLETLRFLGCSSDYKISDKDYTRVYLFDYPRWM